MGHRMDVVVAGNGQQTLVSNGSVVDPDMGELGDGSRLEQAGIIQPGAVKGQQVQLAALQGGQAASDDPGVPGQQQDAQLGHGGKNGETGVSERAVLHAEVSHAFMSGKRGKQFICHRIAFHMKAHQGVTGQLLHDFWGQLRDFKLLFSV